MKYFFALISLFSSIGFIQAQKMLGSGKQPQITVDSKDLVRLVYGDKGKIYYATSNDKGATFSKPVVAGEVAEMHLGMTRGPQLATSKDFSLVTAMDKKGNIHSFRLTHKTGTWEKLTNVNDIDGSAPEGLMSISADENNNFYAVWLDLRNDRKNNICSAALKDSKWSKNKFAYKSLEDHVCECCQPSIVAKGKTVAIMFRNWMRGSRDLYLVTSSDAGQSFSDAQKLGNGTWPLNGCPMDGGGVGIDANNQVHTAWQRDGVVFYSLPGQPEQPIGEGRHVDLNGSFITWEASGVMMMKPINGQQRSLGEGTSLKVIEMKDTSMLEVWEKDDQIFFKKL